MKCPYTVHRRVVQQTIYDYGEDGQVKEQTLVENNIAEPIDCQQENCGAWENGRCNYGRTNE